MPRKPAAVTASPLSVLVENILSTYRASSLEDWSHGRGWYVEAHALAAELSPDNVPLGAAVLAILSPRRSWPQNVALARQAFAYAAEMAAKGISNPDQQSTWWATFPTTGDQRGKLARLFAGEDPNTVVGGPKVRSFWKTITDPLHNDADAVIDRHALAIAEGRVMGTDELSINPATYAVYVRAYAEVAAIVGESASTVQAVTWVHWRRNNAVAFHGDL